MDVWNPGKNRWRYKEGSDEKIIEIELTQGKIALVDAERLEEVKKHRWRAKKDIHIFYANTSLRQPDGEYKTIGMHVLLFPEIVAPRDHIDRNGLNNMRLNLRSGANGINMRNRHTKKKDIGICETEQGYRAQWTESTGKYCSRSFLISNYLSAEDAYNAAVACRVENNDRAISEITLAQQQKRPIESTALPPVVSNTGKKNICIVYRGGKWNRVKAHVKSKGEETVKYFSSYRFDNDLEKAIAAAEEWLKEIKLEKKRKIDNDGDE